MLIGARRGMLCAALALLTTVPAPASAAPKAKSIRGAPSQAAPGTTLDLSVKVGNNAARRSKAGKLLVLLSTDAKAGASDVRAGSAKLRAIKSRKNRSVKVSAKIPATTKPGSMRLLACAASKKGKLPRRPRCASRTLTIVAPSAGAPLPAPQPPAPAPFSGEPAPPAPPAAPPPADPPTFPSGGIDPAQPVEEADPVAVTPKLAGAGAKKAIIDEKGGSITVDHAAGGKTTLTIPADALLGSQVIKVTPIASVAELPFAGGLVQGVDLQPHGLRFQKPVTLTFETPEPVPASAETPLVTDVGGRDLHLYPLTDDPAKLQMQLMHFSGAMVASGTNGERNALRDNPPAGPEAQLEQQLQRVQEGMRKGEPSEELAQAIRAWAKSYWEKVVRPRLIAAETDDTLGSMAVSSALAWMRQLALLGFDDEFETESNEIVTRTGTILRFAYDRAYDRCKAGDIVWATQILALARQAALLGYDGFEDAGQRYLDCVRWELAIQGDKVYRYTGEYSPHTKTMRLATVIPLQVSAGGTRLDGSADWEVVEWSIDDPDNCPWLPAGTEQVRPPKVRILLQLDAQQVNDHVTGKAKAPPARQPTLQLDDGFVKFNYHSPDCPSGGWDSGWTNYGLGEANEQRYVYDPEGSYVFKNPDWTQGTDPVAWLFHQDFHKDEPARTYNYDLMTHMELRRPTG